MHDGISPFNFSISGFRPPISSPQISQEIRNCAQCVDAFAFSRYLVHAQVSSVCSVAGNEVFEQWLLPSADRHSSSNRTEVRFELDKNALKNSLTFYRSQLDPTHRDAAAFLDNLRKVKEEHPTKSCCVALDNEHRLKHVAFPLHEWIQDFFLFEIAPGVSFETKALSCKYSIPLFSINGWDNNGDLLTFMMWYMQAETTNCDEWMLKAFRSLLLCCTEKCMHRPRHVRHKFFFENSSWINATLGWISSPEKSAQNCASLNENS